MRHAELVTEASAPTEPETLRQLLGGRRSALDASLPPAAFVLGWLVSGRSLSWGAGAALAAAVVVAVIRIASGHRVIAVLASAAAVLGASLIAVYTGRAQDFFLIQLAGNIVSALVWTLSILIRWPLLGLVVGTILGQKTRWRRDPDLLRAYTRASWVWVLQYLIRVAVFGALWLPGSVVALGAARIALSWPLVAATVALSAIVFHRTLPETHPGLRHPQ
jgi:hypothetical protein